MAVFKDEMSSLNEVLAAIRELEMAQRYVVPSQLIIIFTLHVKHFSHTLCVLTQGHYLSHNDSSTVTQWENIPLL